MGKYEWQNQQGIQSKNYTCGYCGNQLASNVGFAAKVDGANLAPFIWICHFCGKPSFFDPSGKQTPKPKIGNEVSGIDDQSVKELFDEARKAAGSGAPTAAAMACRVILMHVAVAKGAKKGLKFKQYVNFLNTEGYVPKGLEKWADRIREMGNDANHEIEIMNDEQAKSILKFTETLLKIIYEMPEEIKRVDTKDVKPQLEIQK